MKKIVFVFFMIASCLSFAQKKADINKIQYHYTVLNVENEQLVQQVVDEISALKNVSDCKYRMKPEKKMVEITFIFIEHPRKGEGDESNSPPNVKKLILDKGLQYNGFTFEKEKITE
ncbi:MAG TPA: hypothetical protein VNX01_07440 [Bacteroidia bacterium]|nr:hypothetical protein [Bacteroidia bacterium]